MKKTACPDFSGILLTSALVLLFVSIGFASEKKLTAGDAAADDYFGYSVSISGYYVIVGAYKDDDTGESSGSAYIYYRSGTSWSQQAKLTASDAAANDYFGYSVSISGDYAVVGAYKDDDAGSRSGSAYIFKKPGASWSNMTETKKLTASDAAANDYFGRSVSISGDYVIVGAYYSEELQIEGAGKAYAFLRSGTSWSQKDKQTASDGASEDKFGESVSISGDYAVVGAYNEDPGGVSNAGSAYIYESIADLSLPVELTSFTASVDRDGYVVLEWVTESEIENLGFLLERRSAGEGENGGIGDWIEIASYLTHPELQGQGSVTYRTVYSYTDNTVEMGKTYDYRLADVSYDGVKEYHSITVLGITVTEAIPDRFTVYQNYPQSFQCSDHYFLLYSQ